MKQYKVVKADGIPFVRTFMAVRSEDVIEEIARRKRAFTLLKRGFLARGKKIDLLRTCIVERKKKHKRERMVDLHYLREIQRHLENMDFSAADDILNDWTQELEAKHDAK